MSPQAVVFDFDGLLFDSESAEFLAWSSVFSDHGVELAMSEWCKCVGGGPGVWLAEDHLAELVPDADVASAYALYKERRDAQLGLMPLKEGVLELMDALDEAGVPFGIASSSRHLWVDYFLSSFELRDRVRCIWTRDTAGKAKPWPDSYLKACESLGAEPERAVAFEDSPNGCRAARAAGMKIVGCPNEVTRHFFEDDLCDWKVESLLDVDVEGLRSLF